MYIHSVKSEIHNVATMIQNVGINKMKKNQNIARDIMNSDIMNCDIVDAPHHHALWMCSCDMRHLEVMMFFLF